MAENDDVPGDTGGTMRRDPAFGAPSQPRAVHSRELLGRGRELVILHGTDRYRLTLTAQNKLILTK